MNPEHIKMIPLFEDLFPVDAHILDAICEDMGRNGYDKAHPVIIWKQRDCVIDGHTRILAAQSLNLSDIPVVYRSFTTEDAAVQYAIHCQRDRRNATDADLIRWIEELDKRRTKSEAGKMGRDKQLGQAQGCACPKSAVETAKITNTSTRKVEQTRTILDHADEETKEAVKSGEKSINAAYNETQRKRRKPLEETHDPELDRITPEFQQAITFLENLIAEEKGRDWSGTSKTAAHFQIRRLAALVTHQATEGLKEWEYGSA